MEEDLQQKITTTSTDYLSSAVSVNVNTQKSSNSLQHFETCFFWKKYGEISESALQTESELASSVNEETAKTYYKTFNS